MTAFWLVFLILTVISLFGYILHLDKQNQRQQLEREEMQELEREEDRKRLPANKTLHPQGLGVLVNKSAKEKVDPWEEEFIRNLRSAHHVVKIVEARVYTDPQRTQVGDGFAYICQCKKREAARSLARLEIVYKGHLKKEADKAAAALNKFKLPAGIDWSMNVDE